MELLPGIPNVRYEGPKTDNPFAFRHYDPERRIEGKPMREHLRFAVAFWHENVINDYLLES
jgi:xylose isomerase